MRRSRGRIHLGHVRKARTEPLVVRADERVVADQVDVIVDHHQRPAREPGVDPARGVGQDQRLHPQHAEHPDAERHRLQIVSFVCVRTAGKRGHAAPVQRARRPDGPRGRSRSPPANARSARTASKSASASESANAPEAGAQHDRHLRDDGAEAANRVRGRFDLFVEGRHRTGNAARTAVVGDDAHEMRATIGGRSGGGASSMTMARSASARAASRRSIVR